LTYAIGLAIGETVLNSSAPQWQYAPMWIIDYVIVVFLIVGVWITRRSRNVPILMSAYALSTGVMYMVFFQSLDPDLPEAAQPHDILVTLMGLVFGISVIGLLGATMVYLRMEGRMQ
jgi:hypothetical protein